MATDEEHLEEFMRLVNVANRETSEGRLDAWEMVHTADPAHPGFLQLEIRGMKSGHCFAFNPTCTCGVAEAFVYAVQMLTGRLAITGPNTEGAKVTRLRQKGKPSH